MDGTTKATEFAQLLTCIEMNWMFSNNLDFKANDDDWVPIKKIPEKEKERKTIFRKCKNRFYG